MTTLTQDFFIATDYFKVPESTVPTPALSFGSDSTSGISDESGDIYFSVNSTKRLKLNPTSNAITGKQSLLTPSTIDIGGFKISGDGTKLDFISDPSPNNNVMSITPSINSISSDVPITYQLSVDAPTVKCTSLTLAQSGQPSVIFTTGSGFDISASTSPGGISLIRGNILTNRIEVYTINLNELHLRSLGSPYLGFNFVNAEAAYTGVYGENTERLKFLLRSIPSISTVTMDSSGIDCNVQVRNNLIIPGVTQDVWVNTGTPEDGSYLTINGTNQDLNNSPCMFAVCTHALGTSYPFTVPTPLSVGIIPGGTPLRLLLLPYTVPLSYPPDPAFFDLYGTDLGFAPHFYGYYYWELVICMVTEYGENATISYPGGSYDVKATFHTTSSSTYQTIKLNGTYYTDGTFIPSLSINSTNVLSSVVYIQSWQFILFKIQNNLPP